MIQSSTSMLIITSWNDGSLRKKKQPYIFVIGEWLNQEWYVSHEAFKKLKMEIIYVKKKRGL